MKRRCFMRVAAGLPVPVLFAAVLTGCAEPAPRLAYAERFCYRTLAEVDCHAAPLPGEESRRVGFYDTPIPVNP